MKKLMPVFLVSMLLTSNSFGFIGAVVSTAQSAKDTIYQKFMMLKAIQQLKTLRDNYMASKRYYRKFKELNEGKGISRNLANKIMDIGDQTAQDAQRQFEEDWIYGENYYSDIDQLSANIDDYVSKKIKYAGKVFEKSIDAKKEAEYITSESDGLDAKSKQNLILKTNAMLLQMNAQMNQNLAQLIDIQSRQYKLMLDDKKEKVRSWQIFNKSVENIYGHVNRGKGDTK